VNKDFKGDIAMETYSDLTRAGAWLGAAKLLETQGERIYNLVVEVRHPALATPQSRAIEATVDAFLRSHDAQPVETVAETIFPATEYRLGGLTKVYEYPTTVYPYIRSAPGNNKGTYALRLVQRRCADGTHFNALKTAIDKLRKQLKQPGPQRAVYELDLGLEALELKLYETEDDHRNVRGGQCLSHISLKLGANQELYLTAIYRYQYFIQKALGNFKGLARLQSCIARELGIPVGPLVCHATLAILEDDEVGANWKHSEIRTLVSACEAAAVTQTKIAAA
jgi:hypothetical protein